MRAWRDDSDPQTRRKRRRRRKREDWRWRRKNRRDERWARSHRKLFHPRLADMTPNPVSEEKKANKEMIRRMRNRSIEFRRRTKNKESPKKKNILAVFPGDFRSKYLRW